MKVRKFKLSDSFIEPYKTREVPWGPLGYIVFKRTYARLLSETEPGATGTEEWWQTCRRVIEGMFSIQKKHIQELGLDWSDAKAQQMAKDAYERLFVMKWTPPGRGLWCMGTDFVENRTAAALFNCLAGETEVLTRHAGYQQIKDLVGQKVEVLTSTGAWVLAPINAFGTQPLSRITMTRNNNETKEIFATENHRWFTRKNYDAPIQEVLTKDLSSGSYLQMAYGQGIDHLHPSPQGIQHGIVFGDGSIESHGRSARVALCGNKQDLVKYFQLNTQLSYPDACTGGQTIIRDLPGFYKQAPNLNESRNYLLGWLMGLFATDGSISGNSMPTISNHDIKNIKLVRDVAALLGIPTGKITKEAYISNLTGKPAVLYKIALRLDSLNPTFFLLDTHRQVAEPRIVKAKYNNKNITRQWKIINVEPTTRIEEVYCATVTGHGNFIISDNIVTGNCAFGSTKDFATKGGQIYEWIMDALMLGIGVGFDTLGAGTCIIKKPGSVSLPTNYLSEHITNTNNIYTDMGTKGAVCIIEDSREGWVESLRVLLDCFIFGYALPKFEYRNIRGPGVPIKGFGGISSGPQPLIELHQDLTTLYTQRIGQLITSVDLVDTENLIGRCVVAGNIRRSASIALGHSDDRDFLTMKNDAELLHSHRWASNNSYNAEIGMDYSWHADQAQINGEPGTVWLSNFQNYGRFKDGLTKNDLAILGLNPCGEIGLEDRELCNVPETYPARHTDLNDYLQTIKIAYLYGKTVTLTRTHWKETNAVMQKNRRIGLSQAGVIQSIEKIGLRNTLNWSDKAYQYINELDIKYSDWLCVPRSKKKTSIKPGGSVPLLSGATPGIHYPEDEFYIRRIRFAEGSDLLPALRDANYPIEPCKYSPNTMVVSFPIHEEHFSRGKREVSMWEQLELAAAYQYYWADNSVSVTVTFQEHEAASIKHALSFFETKLKAVSFLRYQETGYVQAPYEPITSAQYNEAIANIRPIQRLETIMQAGVGTKYCDSGACEIDWSKMAAADAVSVES